MRGGVKDHFGSILFEDLAHSRFVANIRDQRYEFDPAEFLQLATDLKKKELGTLDEKYPVRFVVDDLPDELRTDRTAGTGYHHGSAWKEKREDSRRRV